MSYPDLPCEPPPALTPTAPHQLACDARLSQRGATWIRLRGELDLATAPELERALDDGLSNSPLVIIDLRLLTFTDSTGIRRIIEADAEARRRARRLVFIRGPAQVDRWFELGGITERLRIIDLKPGVVPAPALPFPADAA